MTNQALIKKTLYRNLTLPTGGQLEQLWASRLLIKQKKEVIVSLKGEVRHYTNLIETVKQAIIQARNYEPTPLDKKNIDRQLIRINNLPIEKILILKTKSPKGPTVVVLTDKLKIGEMDRPPPTLLAIRHSLEANPFINQNQLDEEVNHYYNQQMAEYNDFASQSGKTLGKFLIMFGNLPDRIRNITSNSPLIRNLTYTSHGYSHPCVSSSACFGNFRGQITDFINNRDMASILEASIALLTAPEYSNPYRSWQTFWDGIGKFNFNNLLSGFNIRTIEQLYFYLQFLPKGWLERQLKGNQPFIGGRAIPVPKSEVKTLNLQP